MLLTKKPIINKSLSIITKKYYNGLFERPTQNIISHLHIIGITVK
jgi:hypothetical protein